MTARFGLRQRNDRNMRHACIARQEWLIVRNGRNVVVADSKIFWSWQSALPEAVNRRFISDALNKVISDLKAGEEIDEAVRIDEATWDTPGTPDIAATIFEKIDRCRMFVCDETPVNPKDTQKSRGLPNPNVLIELGYAAKAIGWSHIVCVLNKAYLKDGDFGRMPFDIRHRSPVTYSLAEDAASEARQSQHERLVESLTQRMIGALQLPTRRFFSDVVVSVDNAIFSDRVDEQYWAVTAKNYGPMPVFLSGFHCFIPGLTKVAVLHASPDRVVVCPSFPFQLQVGAATSGYVCKQTIAEMARRESRREVVFEFADQRGNRYRSQPILAG